MPELGDVQPRPATRRLDDADAVRRGLASGSERPLASRPPSPCVPSLARSSTRLGPRLTRSMLASRRRPSLSGKRSQSGDDEDGVERQRELGGDALRCGVDEEHEERPDPQDDDRAPLGRATHRSATRPTASQSGGRGKRGVMRFKTSVTTSTPVREGSSASHSRTCATTSR